MDKNDLNSDPVLDRKSAARYIGFKPTTLAVWDSTGRHNLQPIKVNHRVRYRKSVLDKFLEDFQRP